MSSNILLKINTLQNSKKNPKLDIKYNVHFKHDFHYSQNSNSNLEMKYWKQMQSKNDFKKIFTKEDKLKMILTTALANCKSSAHYNSSQM